MKLLPRLHRHETMRIHAELVRRKAGPEDVPQIVAEAGVRPHWNPSGGTGATDAEIGELSEALRREAVRNGFPASPSLERQQEFDRAACRILHNSPLLREVGGEVFRPECWAGIVALHVCDLAVWRHGGNAGRLNPERLLGGRRNFLRRLWLRQAALKLERKGSEWILVDRLTEDAIVQIIERPSLSADARVSRAIGFIWLKTAEQGKKNMEAMMRVATKRLRAIGEVVMLSALNDQELVIEVFRAFRHAGKVLGGR